MSTDYVSRRTTWSLTPGDPGATAFEADIDKQRRPVVGFHLEGKCPTCGDLTIGICPASTVNLPIMVASAAAPSLAGAMVPVAGVAISALNKSFGERTTVCVMTCRCAAVHTPPAVPVQIGQPAAVPTAPSSNVPVATFGCGSSWLVKVTYKLFNRSVVSIEPVSDQEAFKYWRAADAVASATPESLTKIQGIAGKWQTALTAITTFLSAAALIGGRDALQKLAPDAQRNIGIAALVSVAASMIAIIAFAYASAGAPSVRPLNGPHELINADLRPIKAAWWSAATFYAAFLAAGTSVVALCCAVNLVWYGDAAATPDKVEITVGDTTSGTDSLCGEATIDDKGVVTIKPGANGAAASSYPASRVVELAAC